MTRVCSRRMTHPVPPELTASPRRSQSAPFVAQPIARRHRWRAPTRSDQVCARKHEHQHHHGPRHRNAEHRLDVPVETRRAFVRPGRQGFPRSSALRGLDSGLAPAGAPLSAAVGCRSCRDSSTQRPRRIATPHRLDFGNRHRDPESMRGSLFASTPGSVLTSVAGRASPTRRSCPRATPSTGPKRDTSCSYGVRSSKGAGAASRAARCTRS